MFSSSPIDSSFAGPDHALASLYAASRLVLRQSCGPFQYRGSATTRLPVYSTGPTLQGSVLSTYAPPSSSPIINPNTSNLQDVQVVSMCGNNMVESNTVVVN